MKNTNTNTMVHSGTPAGIDPATDCALRQFVWEYGKAKHRSRGQFKSLFDALQLGLCGGVARLQHASPPVPYLQQEGRHADAWPRSLLRHTATYIVDPLAGDDAAAADATRDLLGVESSTTRNTTHTGFRTVAAAVAASRAHRRANTHVHIVLESGTHFLAETIHLTARDSHLTIRDAAGAGGKTTGPSTTASAGTGAVVSGGINLTTHWKPSSRCAGCFEASLRGQLVGGLLGLRRNGVREIRARYPNFDPELDSTIGGTRHYHDGQDGWISASTAWVQNASAEGMNGIKPWPPTANATTYVVGGVDWPGVEWPMHIMTNGTADPDTDTGEGEWGQYYLGVGGTCADREPPVGYFCTAANPRKIGVPNHPSGMGVTALLLPNLPYKNATGAVVHAWRPGHWYTNTFEVGSVVPHEQRAGKPSSHHNTTLMFSRGGTQGAEGATSGEAWYIENVEEELDMEREWFFDQEAQTLVYMPNRTDVGALDAATGLPAGDFVGTRLKVLFNVTGTMQAPPPL